MPEQKKIIKVEKEQGELPEPVDFRHKEYFDGEGCLSSVSESLEIPSSHRGIPQALETHQG